MEKDINVLVVGNAELPITEGNEITEEIDEKEITGETEVTDEKDLTALVEVPAYDDSFVIANMQALHSDNQIIILVLLLLFCRLCFKRLKGGI